LKIQHSGKHYDICVFPISPVIVVIFMIMATVAALGIGALSGLLLYQHPWRVAIVGAILLPLLHELYRSRRGAQKPDH
jgi:hypothetical protein